MKTKKKLSVTFLSLLAICFNLNAQRSPDDPKHENHYSVEKIDNDDLTIEFFDAHSQQEFTKVKLKITNKTKDYIFFKSSEAVFKYAHGDYKPKSGGMFKGMDLLIEPMATETKVLTVSGDKKFHVKELKVELNGFYKIPADGKVQEVPDFQLPPANNDFTAGPFKCNLEKSKQETKETSSQFKCVYQGKEVAFVDPAKLSVKIKSGQLYANDNRKDKMEMLMPGEETKFTAQFHVPGKIEDMQFATMFIVWKETFSESKMVPMKMMSANFVFDPGVTEGKNK